MELREELSGDWPEQGSDQEPALGGASSFEDQYEVLETIGKGPWGVVRQCRNRVTGIRYAVKSIEKQGHNQPFLGQKIALLQYLNHPNLVRVKQVCEEDGHWHLVQELVSGGRVTDRLAEVECYSEQEVAGIVRQILEALQYLHGNDLVHQDIKPENLLLASEGGQLKLSDVCLACFLGGQLTAAMCSKAPGYLAPEVLMGSRGSKPGDMWALGVVLYILLMGVAPFVDTRGSTYEFERILQGHYHSDVEGWDRLSSMAKDLIQNLLQADHRKRWTAKQVLNHPWLKGRGTSQEHLEASQKRLREFLQTDIQ